MLKICDNFFDYPYIHKIKYIDKNYVKRDVISLLKYPYFYIRYLFITFVSVQKKLLPWVFRLRETCVWLLGTSIQFWFLSITFLTIVFDATVDRETFYFIHFRWMRPCLDLRKWKTPLRKRNFYFEFSTSEKLVSSYSEHLFSLDFFQTPF